MTNEEAIRRLKPIVDNEAYTDAFQDTCRLAIAALEKQIPKKPLNGKSCPNCFYGGLKYDCEHNLFVLIDYHHCKACGQTIDWSDEK